MSHQHNPIRELVEHLERGESPPFDWVVRWAAGGEEPVLAAWHAQIYGLAMIDLLHFSGRSVGPLACYGDTNPPKWSNEIRRHTPTPPTLAELIAMVAARV